MKSFAARLLFNLYPPYLFTGITIAHLAPVRTCSEVPEPGRGRVVAEFRIDRELIERIQAETADGKKFEPTLAVDVIDEEGDIVAHVTRTLYIRKKRRSL